VEDALQIPVAAVFAADTGAAARAEAERGIFSGLSFAGNPAAVGRQTCREEQGDKHDRKNVPYPLISP